MSAIKDLPTGLSNIFIQNHITTVPELKEALESGKAYQWRGLGQRGRFQLREWINRREYSGCPYCNALLNPNFDQEKSAPIDHEDESIYGPAMYCRQCGRQMRFPEVYPYWTDQFFFTGISIPFKMNNPK